MISIDKIPVSTNYKGCCPGLWFLVLLVLIIYFNRGSKYPSQMTQRSRIRGSEEEGTAVHDPAKRWGMHFELRDIAKARPNFKLILLLVLLSYAVSFACVSLISPIAELYGSMEETVAVSLQTHMILQNHPLKMQGQGSESSESNPRPDNIDCASLINDVGGNHTSLWDDRGILCCDRSHFRTDVCYLRGDVRTHSQLASIFVSDNTTVISTEEKIRPYTRKWEERTMNTIDEITLKRLRTPEGDEHQISCQVQHSVPAIVFSTGGYTGNLYHEFNDGLLPLYITSQHLHGEVVFLILEYHEWWMTKYQEIVNQLTKYPVIDFSRDKRVHCFPEMIVGLKIHEELSINPELMKDGKSIVDFRALLNKAYTPRLRAANASEARPTLAIISRGRSRMLLNQKGIVKLAEKIGFRVEILNPKRTTEMVEMFRALNSCDVMVGVHGAAMTHFLFTRPRSVFIQIVPLGTDWAAATYYGEPATKLGLKYMEYKIVPEESSLFEEYERNDPVLTDPESVNRKGWEDTKRVYLDGQNVRPSLRRLKKTLRHAYAYVRTNGNFTSI